MDELKIYRDAPICYGIDLGTSFTLVACIDPKDISLDSMGVLPINIFPIKQSSPIPLDGDETSEMVASIVAISPEGRPYVGNRLSALKADPTYQKDRTIFYHTKLDLGIEKKPLYEAASSDFDDASKIAGKLLNYCRVQVVGPPNEWRNVVLTVPASFQQSQRRDTIRAMQYAKIEERGQLLIDEPNAAFLGYLNQLNPEERKTLLGVGEANILVIDFGGGTTDLSALTIRPGRPMELQFENHAISRYNDLGGQDLDTMIAEQILLPQLVKEWGMEFTNDELIQTILPQLAVMGEKLKVDLCRLLGASFVDSTAITNLEKYDSSLERQTLSYRSENRIIHQLRLSAVEFQTIVALLFTNEEFSFAVTDKVLQSVPTVIRNILEKSNWSKEDIHAVLLAGGSVQNPLFIRELAQLLPQSKLMLPRRPDLLVAQGAALYSFYQNVLGVSLLKPILAETVGLEIANHQFYPLVQAGTPLPCKVTVPSFKLQRDFQREIEVPFCINSVEEVVATLTIELPSFVTPQDVIGIDVEISTDKVVTFSLYCNDQELGGCLVERDESNVGGTPEQRSLNKKIAELDYLRKSKLRNKERDALRSILWEYYNVGNYKRAISSGEEFLERFDSTDIYVLNLIYCAYDSLGQRKMARSYLERAIKHNPNVCMLITNMVGLIVRESGKAAAATYMDSVTSATVRADEIFRLKHALYKLEAKEENLARQLVQAYQAGSYKPSGSSESSLMNAIFMGLGLSDRDIYKAPIRNSEQEVEETSEVKKMVTSNLLAVRGNLAKQ